MNRRVIVIVAVVAGVFLGGTAEAGRLVTGKHVADGSLTGLDLRDNGLTGPDLADGSLDPASYDGLSTGPSGPRGNAGPAGSPGLNGSSGVHGVQVGHTNNVVVAGGDTVKLQPGCPYGTDAVSAGVEVDAFVSDARMTYSAPLDDKSGWLIYIRNGGGAATSMRASVVCIDED